MAESKIEWTGRSDWNPVRGCTRVSPGCGGPGPHGGCYAEAMAARFSKPGTWGHGFAEMQNGKPRWTGKVELQEDRLLIPLSWRKPGYVFPNSTSDFFHEALTDEAIDKLFAVMALCPHLTFQIPTKRAERMREYCSDPLRRNAIELAAEAIQPSSGKPWSPKHCFRWPLPNVWLGVSTERQQEADERIPHLLQTPAAVRFISAEPLLGPIDLRKLPSHFDGEDRPLMRLDALRGLHHCGAAVVDAPAKLDWVIVGGESGPNARPMHPVWARVLRDQCAAAGVPFFFKQWGEFGPCELYPPGSATCTVVTRDGRHLTGQAAITGAPEDDRAEIVGRFGKARAGRLLDGVEHNGMPEVRP